MVSRFPYNLKSLQNMKQLLSLMALVAMGTIGVRAYDTFEINEIYYEGDPDTQECVIYAYGDDLDYDVVIPQTVVNDGVTYTVVRVDENAFRSCSWLESITLPSTIRTIGRSAFEGCYMMESCNFPESLEEIETFAFFECESLQEVTLPASITSIGDCAFWCCYALESVDLSACTLIFQDEGDVGESVFCECESLAEMHLPANAQYIPVELCSTTALEEIVIPPYVHAIYSCAFANCPNLLHVETPPACEYLEYGAFGNCQSIVSVKLNYGMSIIDDEVFAYDRDILWVYVPSTVVYIGGNAFDTLNITDLYIDDIDTWNSIECANYYSRPNYPAYDSVNVHVRNAQSRSSVNVFDPTDFEPLTQITLAEGTTEVPLGAYCSFGGITSVTLPESLESIGAWAFCSLYDLPSLTIPDNVTSIGERAFWFNYTATDLTLGSGLQTIDRGAFEDWDELLNVTCRNEDVPAAGEIVFSDYLMPRMTLHVPAASVEAYSDDDFWSQFGQVLAITGTSVDEMETQGGVSLTADGRVVATSQTATVRIYDTSGRLLESFCGEGSATALTKGKVYIIMAGDKAFKIKY